MSWDKKKKGPVMRTCVKSQSCRAACRASWRGKVVNENLRANLRAFLTLGSMTVASFAWTSVKYIPRQTLNAIDSVPLQ